LLFLFGHFWNESIAHAWHSEDITLSVLAIAKGLAQKKDVLAQVALFHEAVWPDGLHEFRLLDDSVAVVNQEQENFEGLRREGERLSAMQEQAFLPVHPERAKIAEAFSLLHHAAILRTLRRIEPIPKDIEQPLRAGCNHGGAQEQQERARCAAESITGTRRDA
jgi:hypothetical protein